MDVLDFLSAETVSALIEDKGTKIATVEFLKLDGSVRKANGLFRPSSHIVGSERGYQQGEMMRQKGLVPFFDLQKKHWISFYVNRVVDIK